MSEQGEYQGPLVKNAKKGYVFTDEGFRYVTELLESGGFFSETDLSGFEVNKIWAGIMGTHMIEAAERFLKRASEKEKLDEEEEMHVVLVALYSSTAHAEVNKSLKVKRRRRT